MQPPSEVVSDTPEEQTDIATDILTPEEEEKLEPVMDSIPPESRKLSEEDLANIMQDMVDRMQNPDLEQINKLKEFGNKEKNKNLMIFVVISLASILAVLYLYYYIKTHNDLNLSFLLYVTGFLVLRTIVMGVTYMYLIDDSTDDCINMANKTFSIVSILSCLAIILVIGIVGYLETSLISHCFPYVLMDAIITFRYLKPCGGCSHYY